MWDKQSFSLVFADENRQSHGIIYGCINIESREANDSEYKKHLWCLWFYFAGFYNNLFPFSLNKFSVNPYSVSLLSDSQACQRYFPCSLKQHHPYIHIIITLSGKCNDTQLQNRELINCEWEQSEEILKEMVGSKNLHFITGIKTCQYLKHTCLSENQLFVTSRHQIKS